jgi:hypothetical protein
MTDQALYFGRPGALETLYLPRGGVESPRIRLTNTFQLSGGGTRVTKMLGGRRVYSLNYQSLDQATFDTLHGYHQGHEGPGPFCFLDPGQRNLLTVNQSSSTAESNSTSNFTVAGTGGTIASSTTAHRGPRSLLWSFSVSAPASALLYLDPPAADWPGIPVVDRPLVFWFYAKASGTAVTLTARLDWLDEDGAAVSSTSGTPVSVGTSDWSQVSVTGSPPATAVYVNCSVVGTSATIAANDAVRLSEFMLHEGSTPEAWTTGTGVHPVQPVSLEDAYTLWPAYRNQPVFMFEETGGG